MTQSAFAPGKMILSGDHAVVFGYPGIAVPLALGVTAAYQPGDNSLEIEGIDVEFADYVRSIASLCDVITGALTLDCTLPIGKGLGSSTAFVVAIVKRLKGDDQALALEIEDRVNPGHSGLDFSVIWENRPVMFRKGQPATLIDIHLPEAILIDTGRPNESTPELVAWMKSREQEMKPYLEAIGRCTERLIKDEDLATVIRDHHRAQLGLGVVTKEAAELITKIEAEGGAAKVLGAGSRTGGCGMVLAIGIERMTLDRIVTERKMSVFSLQP